MPITTLDTYDLERGDDGQEVRRLQRTLNDTLGMKKPLVVDGDFGPKTESAVLSFQASDCRLGPSGVADPATLRALGIHVMPGVDLSSYQRDTEMDKVVAAGAGFIYRKATEGQTHVNRERGNDPGDKTAYKRDVDAAHALNVPAGFYHFGRPDTNPGATDAIREAKHFIRTIRRIRQTLQPTLDVEKGIKKGWHYNAQWVVDWCDYTEERLAEEIKAEFGLDVRIQVVIYTARWAINLFLRRARAHLLEQILARPLWLADYDGYPDDEIGPWDEWTIHQHTGTGRCPGVHGKCDLNYLSGAGIEAIRIAGV